MSPCTPASTTAKLNFLVQPEDGTRAFQVISPDDAIGDSERNFSLEEREIVVENLRGKESLATLDTAGFQLFTRPSKHKAFVDNAEIQRGYYPESEELIKEITGASKVVLFDHTLRRRRTGNADDDSNIRGTVSRTHVDQTTASSIARVHRHLPPADAPALLRRRFQIINLWRPISHPAIDWPLALCDYRSVDPKNDTFPIALIFPGREGESMGVSFNPNQRWKYFHGMTPDEFVLLKCFDSVQDGSVAVFTPHTGFEDPSTPNGTPPRESIELRALVFYD